MYTTAREHIKIVKDSRASRLLDFGAWKITSTQKLIFNTLFAPTQQYKLLGSTKPTSTPPPPPHHGERTDKTRYLPNILPGLARDIRAVGAPERIALVWARARCTLVWCFEGGFRSVGHSSLDSREKSSCDLTVWWPRPFVFLYARRNVRRPLEAWCTLQGA